MRGKTRRSGRCNINPEMQPLAKRMMKRSLLPRAHSCWPIMEQDSITDCRSAPQAAVGRDTWWSYIAQAG